MGFELIKPQTKMMISPSTILSFTNIKQLCFQSFGQFPFVNVLLLSCDVIVNHIIFICMISKKQIFFAQRKI